jgi:cyclopropane fatty-acyl-phospholipid synthase-like methyltransferase
MIATQSQPRAEAEIDPGQVRAFWESQAGKLGSVPLDSMANLEERPGLLEQKIRREQECLVPLLRLERDASLLDLGAGAGQWTFRFAARVRRVVAVEYTEAMAAIGRAETARRGLGNVQFITAAAQDFESSERFDAIFISGLLLYLNDADVRKLTARLPRWIKPGGRVLVRDAASVLPSRHLIANRYSELLRARYSAIYRTTSEIRAAFAPAGFGCENEGQIFPEGSPLNKFPETRLRYFLFRQNPEAFPGHRLP